jgi:hypothetical protein
VKKDSDEPDKNRKQVKERKQMLGLALLEIYFNMPTFIVYLHAENERPLSSDKKSKWLRDYNAAKIYIDRHGKR